jgi:hypothetical protein
LAARAEGMCWMYANGHEPVYAVYENVNEAWFFLSERM